MINNFEIRAHLLISERAIVTRSLISSFFPIIHLPTGL